jgi:hypothetical protein
LQADRQEEVAETIQRLAVQEIGREIDGKARGILAKLAEERGFVEAGHQYDELFDLIGLKHRNFSAYRNKSIRVPFVTVSGGRITIFITLAILAGSCQGSVFHGGWGPAVRCGVFAQGYGGAGALGAIRGRG